VVLEFRLTWGLFITNFYWIYEICGLQRGVYMVLKVILIFMKRSEEETFIIPVFSFKSQSLPILAFPLLSSSLKY